MSCGGVTRGRGRGGGEKESELGIRRYAWHGGGTGDLGLG